MGENFEIKKEFNAEEQGSSSGPQDIVEKLNELSLEEYLNQGQKFLDSNRKLLITFARDSSLAFKLSEKFFIDFENGEVNLDTKWFAEKGYSKEQILWANLHEIAHFLDFMEDTDGTMKNFDYIMTQAKKTGAVMMKKWEEKYGEEDPEFIRQIKERRPVSKKDPKKTMNSVEIAAYEMHHRFFNILDDIYVNNLISRKAPRFEKESEGGEIARSLYREKLFKPVDFSKLPRHIQFTDSLIRKEMIENEEVIVSDEVKEALERKIRFQGKECTAREIIENFIKPKKDRNTKPSYRHFVLRQTLEPVFLELLAKDLEDSEYVKSESKKGKSGEGKTEKGKDENESEKEPQEQEGDENEPSANPFEKDYEDYKENNPDQIKPEDIKQWVDKKDEEEKNKKEKEEEEQKEDQKTAEEKAKESQEELDDEWCKKKNINRETLKQFRKIEAEVASYLEDLSRLWRRIVFGSARETERDLEGYFKTGTELDVQKAIEEWPKIEKGDIEKVRVMKKMMSKEVLIQRPELIRVRLVGDVSGSMDAKKIHILQQCFVLLLSSLDEFNNYLNLDRGRTKSKLSVDTEAWTFSNVAERVKNLRSKVGANEENVEIVKIFEKLMGSGGGTYDNQALKAIFESLTSEDKEKIAQEKIMEIVFEITDGGSSAKNETLNAVDSLKTTGVIIRAFQIGNVNQNERQIFNEVWNIGREEKLGENVGSNIEKLLPAVTEALKKYLGNVRL